MRAEESHYAIVPRARSYSTQPIEHQTLGRGLAYHEVAIVKRMRELGFVRDYIFSFLIRPGRKLSPACISEVEQGKIGPEVEPASEDEVRRFVSLRLKEAGPPGNFYGPLSTFQVNETLGWFTRAQGDLLRDESQTLEFKLCLPTREDKLVSYAKTMSAFANNSGGYIFFGITDERRPVGIQADDYVRFDWDRLAAVCREYFQPDFRWERALVEWSGVRLASVYVYESDSKPIVSVRTAQGMRSGEIFFRYRGHTSYIGYGDLANLLAERDARVRAAAVSRFE